MKILRWEIGKNKKSWHDTASQAIQNSQMSAILEGESYYVPFTTSPFDGEKTPGELGHPVKKVPLYQQLAMRSWEAYLTSDVAQMIINRFVDWTIGTGLKLQSEPDAKVIAAEGFNLDKSTFTDTLERRWSLYTKNRVSSYSMQNNLHTYAKLAKRHSIIGGDALCIIRTTKQGPNIQIIDGMHVQTPWTGSHTADAKDRGNRIIHGVEIDKTGKHIKYYVVNADMMSWTVIDAIGTKTKRLQAYLIYGNQYRVDEVRGLPLLSAVLEKLKKLDRYTEATVGGAEERAKVAYSIEHGTQSTGQSPMINLMKQSVNAGEGNELTGIRGELEDTSKKVAQTTGKMTFNMPIDSTLKALESRQEINYGEFMDKNIEYIAPSLNMPPEVAKMLFTNSFSASRMAGKMWEHVLEIIREEFSSVFYKPFFNLFLEIEILNEKVRANGYLSALDNALKGKDVIFLEAYQNCRFIGSKVPHVDPVKEVNAEIMKVNNGLSTREKATENLSGGDYYQNQEKLKEEEKVLQQVKPNNEGAD